MNKSGALALGIIFGASIGAILKAVTGDTFYLGMGVGIGMSVGLAVGAALPGKYQGRPPAEGRPRPLAKPTPAPDGLWLTAYGLRKPPPGGLRHPRAADRSLR